MYAGRNRKTSAFDRKIAQPVNTMRRPRYIGFRVIVYIPQVTKEEDDCGFVGFTVVLARRKVTTPEMAVTNPPATRRTAKRI